MPIITVVTSSKNSDQESVVFLSKFISLFVLCFKIERIHKFVCFLSIHCLFWAYSFLRRVLYIIKLVLLVQITSKVKKKLWQIWFYYKTWHADLFISLSKLMFTLQIQLRLLERRLQVHSCLGLTKICRQRLLERRLQVHSCLGLTVKFADKIAWTSSSSPQLFRSHRKNFQIRLLERRLHSLHLFGSCWKK